MVIEITTEVEIAHGDSAPPRLGRRGAWRRRSHGTVRVMKLCGFARLGRRPTGLPWDFNPFMEGILDYEACDSAAHWAAVGFSQAEA